MDELQIYQNEDGSIALDVTLQSGSIWLYQQQMADLFDTTVANINIHLKSIYSTGELGEEATIKESLIVRQEGCVFSSLDDTWTAIAQLKKPKEKDTLILLIENFLVKQEFLQINRLTLIYKK